MVGDHSGMAQAKQTAYAGHVPGIFTQLSPQKHFVFWFRSGMSVSWAALVKAGGVLHQGTGTATGPWEASNKNVWHLLTHLTTKLQFSK